MGLCVFLILPLNLLQQEKKLWNCILSANYFHPSLFKKKHFVVVNKYCLENPSTHNPTLSIKMGVCFYIRNIIIIIIIRFRNLSHQSKYGRNDGGRCIIIYGPHHIWRYNEIYYVIMIIFYGSFTRSYIWRFFYDYFCIFFYYHPPSCTHTRFDPMCKLF